MNPTQKKSLVYGVSKYKPFSGAAGYVPTTYHSGDGLNSYYLKCMYERTVHLHRQQIKNWRSVQCTEADIESVIDIPEIRSKMCSGTLCDSDKNMPYIYIYFFLLHRACCQVTQLLHQPLHIYKIYKIYTLKH